MPRQKYLHADIESIKKIYGTFARSKQSPDHSHHLELMSLESAHVEFDLIATYKIVHILIGVSLNDVGLSLYKK